MSPCLFFEPAREEALTEFQEEKGSMWRNRFRGMGILPMSCWIDTHGQDAPGTTFWGRETLERRIVTERKKFWRLRFFINLKRAEEARESRKRTRMTATYKRGTIHPGGSPVCF
jgi:hypothetical protein